MKEKIKVTTKEGKVILVYREEATMLERLGKLIKERKTGTQTKELKTEPETKETDEEPKKPMSTGRNLKNTKSGN